MPLFLTLHPWPGGTMSRDDVVKLVSASQEAWREKGLDYRAYMGTPNNGDGWSLVVAPSREMLLRAFHEQRIPYLYVTEVWQVSGDEANLAVEAGAGNVPVI